MPDWLPVVLWVLLPLLLWCAWWVFCVNWKKTWPVLSRGGWVPVVLLVLVASLAWSRISLAPCECLPVTIPNFLWQLFAVTGLVLLALFCGWVQGQLGWTPAEVSFDPTPASMDMDTTTTDTIETAPLGPEYL